LREEVIREYTSSESTFHFYSLVINKWKSKLAVKMLTDTNIDQGLLGTPEIKKKYFPLQIFQFIDSKWPIYASRAIMPEDYYGKAMELAKWKGNRYKKLRKLLKG